ncbi:hypothetical protein F5Y06DRAFT_25378 [Hypoxylon sp. FL0890]|nr:hypothetical protein F5Y06DRAFT_25378 [Hypoxylon sp. FL0890]
MELANHPCQEGVLGDAGRCSADITVSGPPRKSSLTNNFSYPRPEEHLRRHESSDSRSSLTSNGSLPGMTDSSDSDTSFEEDSNYNTSASELWDSFWPDHAVAPEEQYPVLLRASQTPNYFTKSFSKRKSEETDDTITISKLERDAKKTSNSQCKTPVPQLSPSRPSTRNGSPTYSVYPKIEPPNPLRSALPPRTSSLSTVPLSPPRRQALKTTKSTVNLKFSKSSHSLRPQHAMPPVSKMPVLSPSASSVPVSPAYPPPPPPQILRSAASAINLRDRNNSLGQIQHNATAPLSPLSRAVPMLEPQQPSQSQAERYISVFEIDSDAESYMESNSFTKRIARGFHKKSASEKRSTSGRRASDGSDSQGSEKDKGKESSSRKRGGSLGRILGLRSR